MKKTVAALLAAVICVAGLAGCKGRRASDPLPQGDTVEVTFSKDAPAETPDSIPE